MERSELTAVAAAEQLVGSTFADPLAAFLGGSALTDRRTETSDLDIVVVIDGSEAPYRQTTTAGGWLVELFVHRPDSLRWYWDRETTAGRSPLLRMVAEGRIVHSVGSLASEFQSEARQRWAAGPRLLDHSEVDRRRYGLTDLLDDLEGCGHPGELVYIAAAVVVAASELALIAASSWLGSGKWLGRELLAVDPALHDRLVAGHQAALCRQDRAGLMSVAYEVLERAGGPLREGYYAQGKVNPNQE